MAHSEQSTFGALLRRFRLAAGLSQEELAERSDLSQGAIGALERGVRRAPYPHTVAQLVAALELSPSERIQFETAASKQPRQKRATAAVSEIAAASSAPPVRPAQTSTKGGAVPILVGRAGECAWLQQELAAGSPLVLLAGEPGIGKSRLLREAMGWARQHGWRALWGGCHRSGGQEPYSPLVEALERHTRALPPEQRRASLAGCEWLAHLLPGVPELADAGRSLMNSDALPSTQERRLLFSAVERYLSNIAGRAGTLLVLDDLQWAGADALQMLARLVRSTRMGRLQILGAYRSTEVPPGHPLSILMADLAREELVSHLNLAPLQPQDAAVLVRAILEGEGMLRTAPDRADGGTGAVGDTPVARIVERVVERVVERGGGMPFFLVSCARWWQSFEEANDLHASGGRTASASDASDAQARTADPQDTDLQKKEEVPWEVRQSIRERVAALPVAAQELLAVAAVVGQRTSRSVLAAATDQSELETLSGLEMACQAGLLVEEPERARPERYRFAHDVIRDVVEANLSAGRQTLLHRRVAVALEQGLQHRGAVGPVNERVLTQLAYHYGRADMPEQAALYLRQAGDHARDVYAHQEAAQYYQELVTCLDRLEQSSREAARARRDLAVELLRVGRFREAVAPVAQAEEICRATGDVEMLALVTTTSGYLHAALGASEEGLARIEPLVRALAWDQEDARDTAGAESTALSSGASAMVTALLQGALSSLCFIADHYRDALDAAERAVRAAQATGDTGLLARERIALGVALLTVGRLDEAIEQLEHAVEGAEAVGNLETLAEALRMASWVYQTRGAFAKSQAVQARGLAVARRLGDMVGLGHTLFLEALLAFYLGNWDQARAIGESSLAVVRTGGVSHLSAYPPLGLGWLRTIQGDQDTGEQYLAEAEAQARQNGLAQVLRFSTALRAECELLAGQPHLAHARLLPWFSGEPMQERTRLELGVLRAWAAVELSAKDEADAWVGEAVRSARACQMHLILPDALRVQALWAMRQQKWEEAERVLEEAASLSHAMPYPYAEAKALYVLGQLWMTTGEPARACGRLAEALAICHGLGERLYGEAIERSLAVAQAAVPASAWRASQNGRDPGRTTGEPE